MENFWREKILGFALVKLLMRAYGTGILLPLRGSGNGSANWRVKVAEMVGRTRFSRVNSTLV